MGWEDSADGPEGGRPGDVLRPFVDLNATAAVCAAQPPAVGLIWWIGTQRGDDYGGSPYGLFFALALACLLVVAPLVLPFVGLAHAVAHIVPADFLARLAVRHVRGPAWAWHLVCTVALGAAWAALAALLWGWSFTVAAALLTALGVLPVLGLAYLRTRARTRGRPQGFWAVWLPSLFASVTLFLLVFVGGVLATATGLVEEYEPPHLSAGQLAGVWRGADGAVLRLDPGAKAQVSKLPTQSESGDWYQDPIDVCDGTGSWSPGEQGGRDVVLVRLDGGCGRDTYWTIGGTEREPELFVLFGDPDAGDLRILNRTS
ncbi:hypothetical protein [Streptomyces cyaneus]|uniref:hypothetical protein n=1 Tax=Streptomyces cyaneus TaxID=1904 RepID=UPI001FEC21EB|nr:hypothetical protein [Streptomyces cyaneus]